MIGENLSAPNVKATPPRVVIVGGGFGGLWAAKTLANLTLQPFDLNLLGLELKSDPVNVTIAAQTGAKVETAVVVERALTIFLNAQEIVTAMTINDYPE